MNKQVTFTVFGRPAQMGSKKAFYSAKLGRSFIVDANDKAKKQWANAVSAAAGEAMKGRELFKVPVEVIVRFYFQRPQSHFGSGKNADKLKASAPDDRHGQSPDVDKLGRCLHDALTGIVYSDDKLIWHSDAYSHWTTGQERAEVEIRI